MNTLQPKKLNEITTQAKNTPQPTGILRVNSSDLFQGHTELEILHNDVIYRLRKTSLGKLILTK